MALPSRPKGFLPAYDGRGYPARLRLARSVSKLHPEIEGLINGFHERPDSHSLGVLADKLEEMGHPHAATLRDRKTLAKHLGDHLHKQKYGADPNHALRGYAEPILSWLDFPETAHNRSIWGLPHINNFLPTLLTTSVIQKARPKTQLVDLPEEVAVLDEHLLTNEDGKPIEQLTPEILQRIADNNNKRIKDTGDYCPIVIGHTKDGDHEKDQPEVVGFAGPFKVKKFFNTGKKALFARWRVFKDKVDLLRKFPRRSVELWVSRWEIDPISILGATTPDRDLGLVKLSRGGEQPRTQECPVDPSQIAQQVVALIQQTDEWKFLSQLKSEAEGMEEGAPDPTADMNAPPEMGDETGGEVAPEGAGMEDPNDGPPMGDEQTDAEYEGEDDLPPGDDEMPQQMSAPVRGKPQGANIYSQTGGQKGDAAHVYRKAAACGSAPSGGNTFVPSYGKKKMARPAVTPSKPSSKAESDRIRLARMERQFQQNAAEVTNLRVQLARATREKDFVQLEAEGYLLDRDEELDAVSNLSDDQYGEYLVKLKRNYRKAPSTQAPGLFDRPGPVQMSRHPQPRQTSSKARTMEAVDLATRKGIKFEEALTQLTNGEPTR